MAWFWQRPTPAVDVDPALWRQAAAGMPWLRSLDVIRAARLRALVAAFLDSKTITPVQGLQLNDVQRLRLAMLCCLPLLEFGREGLHGWSQLLGCIRMRSVSSAAMWMRTASCMRARRT